MLIAAAVCPHPPLLVPEAACGAAAELDEMRAACDAAVTVLAAADPDLIVTVGGAAETAEFEGSAAGSLAAYGVEWQTGAGTPVLPLSLTIGRWLLQRAGLVDTDPGERAGPALRVGPPLRGGPALPGGRPGTDLGEGPGPALPGGPALRGAAGLEPERSQRVGLRGGHPGEEPARSHSAADVGVMRTGPAVLLHATAFGAPTATCLRRGADIAARARRVALLALGDGPACLSPQAPGYFDARAQRYDADVTAALANADAGRLARLDPDLSADLLAAGRAAWQVLAGAAGDGRYRGDLHCAAAPYGVSYLVASWTAIMVP